VSEISLLVLAFGLGLLGFIEPCSLGAHGVFLGQLREKDRATRLRETLKFSLTRSVILGLFGLGIALLGGAIFSVQKGFWFFLGLLYLALGIAIILNARFRWDMFGHISPNRLLPKRADLSLGMGVVFGLNLPACAVPLMLALLGRSAASGALWGFASLFVFGLALSLPLAPLAFSERTPKLFERLTRFSGATPYVIGVALLAIAAYVIYTATPYFDVMGNSA
jgi:cytochrome c-type biogenesis protein